MEACLNVKGATILEMFTTGYRLRAQGAGDVARHVRFVLNGIKKERSTVNVSIRVAGVGSTRR
jgi:hypothetical protein